MKLVQGPVYEASESSQLERIRENVGTKHTVDSFHFLKRYIEKGNKLEI